MIPGELDFGIGFEGFDGGENVRRNFGVALVIFDEDLERFLFGVAIFAGFFVGEVFGDFEGGEFSRMATLIRA